MVKDGVTGNKAEVGGAKEKKSGFCEHNWQTNVLDEHVIIFIVANVYTGDYGLLRGIAAFWEVLAAK